MPKFLIDENLSPRLATILRSLGHNAVAVRDIGLRGHDDTVILAWAIAHERVIITRDWEFGQVAFWHAAGRVGMVILRSMSQRVGAHAAILRMLHHEGALRDERLASTLLLGMPTSYRWWPPE